MADSIYKVIELIGTSNVSWEDAAKKAVSKASETLEDLRIAEVVTQDIRIENGKVVEFRTKLSLSFKFHKEWKNVILKKTKQNVIALMNPAAERVFAANV